MQKSKYYPRTKFPTDVITQAYTAFKSKTKNVRKLWLELTFGNERERWKYDTLEEFLAEYPNATEYELHYYEPGGEPDKSLSISSEFDEAHTEIRAHVSVELLTRSDIQSVFQIFEANLSRSALPRTPPTIFIGHGRDAQWRDLKDHLQDKHGLKVVAYESGPRAGLSVKEVLKSMLKQGSFACLVLTGEDTKNNDELHARENVIHELGLFQARIGFERAIALLEAGVTEFSNIEGVNQIRFSKGDIRETFGEVLATIKREYGEQEERS